MTPRHSGPHMRRWRHGAEVPVARHLPPSSRPGAPGYSSLDAFVRAEGASLLRSALALTRGHESRAEDLVQTVLVKLAARGGVDDLRHPLAYARRALINASHDVGRSDLALAKVLPRLASTDHEHDDTIGAVDRQALLSCMQGLSPRERSVIVLRYWEDRPDREIAHLLGCRPATVRSLAHRSLHKLRRRLEPHGFAGE